MLCNVGAHMEAVMKFLSSFALLTLILPGLATAADFQQKSSTSSPPATPAPPKPPTNPAPGFAVKPVKPVHRPRPPSANPPVIVRPPNRPPSTINPPVVTHPYHRPHFARPLPPRDNQFYHRGAWSGRVRGPAYAYPHGYGYRRWDIGSILPRLLFGSSYFYNDWAGLGLEAPPPGYNWVRYGSDLLLVNLHTGEVEDVVYGVFY